MLAVSDIAASAADWQPQMDRVISGSAVYAVMGDWAACVPAGTKKLAWQREYSVAAAAGQRRRLRLPVRLVHAAGRRPPPGRPRDWLLECGSTEGQNLFNPLKGSVPARLDADPAPYNGYLEWALQQWRDPKTRIVGSLTHGVVADNAWNAEIDTALGLFVQNGDTAKFAATVAAAVRETR